MISKGDITDLLFAIDEAELVTCLPSMAATTSSLVRMAKEEEVEESHAMVYVSFLHYIFTVPDREHSKNVLSHFLKIPKKKRNNFDSDETKKWIEVQVAKNFYQPIQKMISRENCSNFSPNTPMYYAMTLYVLSYLNQFKGEELLEKYDSIIKEKNFNEMSRMNLTLFMLGDDLKVIEMALVKMKSANLYHTFSYYLNEIVKSSYLNLLKYGKNETIMNLGESQFAMATEIITDDINKALIEKREYEGVVKEYEKTIHNLNDDIEHYKIVCNLLAIENNQLERKPFLKDLSVLIIGDTKNISDYLGILKFYGATNVEVLDGLQEPYKIRDIATNKDIIYVFTAYSDDLVKEQLNDLLNVIMIAQNKLHFLENKVKNTYEELKLKISS